MDRRVRVGILGGGQLGMMLAEALLDLDADVAVYDPHADAPARRRVPDFVTARWDDREALTRFLSRCDAVTYEFEHIETRGLHDVLASLDPAPPVHPRLDVLDVLRDRLVEKSFLRDAGLPHAAFAHAVGRASLRSEARAFGYPFMLKTARGGYDGKGQFTIRSDEALEIACDALESSLGPNFGVVLEDPLPLELEASAIAVGDQAGGFECFPVFENVHRANILDFTVVPARVPMELHDALTALAVEAARRLGVVGLLTTEFFVTREPGERGGGRVVTAGSESFHVYVNELAPRPHNSGHVTRSACDVSQFDALARVLLGLPAPAARLISDDGYCMVNLLGDVWLAQGRSALDVSALTAHPAVLELVLYGKEGAKPRRKMGHVTTHGATVDEALADARA
ncbi:MAG: ATP-grasp domain-containing protein, partial [Deltaproteobacteria bacterium]|nr:ATP-grasp domain-containing protein [Deltaproteobacteria bacterium]